MHRLDVTDLSGTHVTLEPVRPDHAEEIAAAGAGDRSSYSYTLVPDGVEAAAQYVATALDEAAHGRIVPFVQRRTDDGLVVGCTRFLDLLWPLGREYPDEVEVGGTWLSPTAQRTAVNTEAKLLLLGQAFDVWGVQRVAICTDARNAVSRRAIERLGAHFEGVMRRHRTSRCLGESGRLRDTATYSITADDWPSVHASLSARLAERPAPTPTASAHLDRTAGSRRVPECAAWTDPA